MKKILYSLSTLALLTFLAGCSKEADNPVGLETEGGLLALIEPDTQTKTNYDSIEGKFVWAEGDQVAIHYNDGSYKTVAVNASTGMLNAPNPTLRDYFAVYPASVADAADYGNSALRITLPDSYDISDMVSGGKSADFSPCPMVASNASSTSKLNFYHVGGLLRVTLKDLPALTQKIRVTFDKDVTGSYTVSNPGSTNPTITTAGAASNNTVTFTLAQNSVGTLSDPVVLNIPVPCGTYDNIQVESLGENAEPLTHRIYAHPLKFSRHHGKKVSVVMLNLGISVSPDMKVRFAPGNLIVEDTFDGTAHERVWRFGTTQWEMYWDDDFYDNDLSFQPGETKRLCHFPWASAGVKNPAGDFGYDSHHIHYWPHERTTWSFAFEDNGFGFGPSGTQTGWAMGTNRDQNPILPHSNTLDPDNSWNNNPEVRKYCDWGVHFNDKGEGLQERTDGTWFTLSNHQWHYILWLRPNALNLYGWVRIAVSDTKSVYGLCILPDEWILPPDCSDLKHNNYSVYYAPGVNPALGDSGPWHQMEAAGAVFLPNSGYYEYGALQTKNDLHYWTSSSSATSTSSGSNYNAFKFHSLPFGPGGCLNVHRHNLLSVRLVHML